MSGSFDINGPSIMRYKEGPLAWVEVTRPGLREFFAVCVPHDTIGTRDAATQAREVYRALASWLHEQAAMGVQERILGNLAHRETIIAERQRLLGAEDDSQPWVASFVEGTPCDREGLAGVQLYAVAGPACTPIYYDRSLCGVAFEHQDARHVHLTGISGAGNAATRREEAQAMLARANAVLQATGCSYADVVRTWICLADILQWYDEFNPVRSALYSQFVESRQTDSSWPPASTGIEGRAPGGAHCLMDLFAISGPGRRDVSVEALRNPRQSEAYGYGSAFSRGMAVTFDNLETVYVSGTAAVDEEGRSACIGDIRGQVNYTLDNIVSLLSTRHMTLDDFVSSTIFIKQGHSTEIVRELIEERGKSLANGVYVVADICRPELLFEVDGTAVRVSD